MKAKTAATAGFTLLEIMIAVAIAGVVLTSAFMSLGQAHRNTAHITQKMAADLVAKNQMEQFFLPVEADKRPQPKNTTGTAEMGGFSLHYRIVVTPASMPGLKKVDVVVLDAKDTTVLRTLSSYIPTES